METWAVLWDMDGVLADSTQLHYQSWKATFDPRGMVITDEMFRRTFGRNNRAVLTDIFGRPPSEEELEQISTEKESWFCEHIPGNMDLLPGALDWLKRFQSWGFLQAVASSAPSENIEAQVDSLGIRPYFGALVSAANLPGKPDPAVFLKAANLLGVSPARSVVIEDAPAGVEGARRGGMLCIAVLTTQMASALQGADLVVYRLTDLKENALCKLLGLPALEQ
jgi:HAD superfamily hydrolase (TIGR01509 family)